MIGFGVLAGSWEAEERQGAGGARPSRPVGADGEGFARSRRTRACCPSGPAANSQPGTNLSLSSSPPSVPYQTRYNPNGRVAQQPPDGHLLDEWLVKRRSTSSPALSRYAFSTRSSGAQAEWRRPETGKRPWSDRSASPFGDRRSDRIPARSGDQAPCYPASSQVARHRTSRSYGLSCRP